MKRLFLVLSLLMLSAQMSPRVPILVPEISQHEVQVRQGFVGTELLLFGAILDPLGARAGRDYDIIVVLKGPSRPIRLREKERVAGMWINAQSTAFRSAPVYFAVASSKPVADIVDEKTAAIYELGLAYIQLSPTGAIDPVEQERFSSGLVDLRERQGLFREVADGVQIKEDVLYQSRIYLPSNVQTGIYTAETFAISDGRVIASAIEEVTVRKVGMERLVEVFADEWSLYYGLLAVFISVFMGWLAGRLFALI